MEIKDDRFVQSLDSRFPTSITADEITERVRQLAERIGGAFENTLLMEPFLVKPDSPVIQALLDAYTPQSLVWASDWPFLRAPARTDYGPLLDVFVLDMGQPVKIMDLARRMVELSGLTVKDEQSPEGDIEIAVTGLRPGEKLYEELLIGDNPKPTVHPRIMKAHEEFIPWAEFEAKLNALDMALNVNDVGVIRLMMQQLVAGYTPSDDLVDWVYLEQEAEAQAG